MLNGMLENIKYRPKRFVVAFILPCLIMWIGLLIFGTSMGQFLIYGIGVVIVVFINFNLYISNEVVDEKLNNEIRKKNISKEELFEITGLTQYEVSQKENHFEFYCSPTRKKKYLKMIEEYE
ncbi:hypothetical protein [Mammaliicoccus sp. Dog046]|uniref:hypothetical protein n=1 Tax=Mammaliicoccus sp. Dog046 TaxID=3034233 RepID=UPI002B261635|nr:hypothetical protein [Mammaliicoccus sp. Dog046]WQK85390.1 hypothetical protein P3U32_12405 [Mammaliicoccus sp. Dog046]